jgi:hypothetical protein
MTPRPSRLLPFNCQRDRRGHGSWALTPADRPGTVAHDQGRASGLDRRRMLSGVLRLVVGIFLESIVVAVRGKPSWLVLVKAVIAIANLVTEVYVEVRRR